MTAQIRFDQTGLPAGTAGRSRSDGLSGGQTVTVTNVSANPCRCEFYWKPPDDAAAVITQVSPTTWQFTPAALTYGEYIVRMIENEGAASETVDVKAFGIRYPRTGLLQPGFNSKGDPDINLASNGVEKAIAAALSMSNEPLPDAASIDYAAWWHSQRELFRAVEAGGLPSVDRVLMWDPSGAMGGESEGVYQTLGGAVEAAVKHTGRTLVRMTDDPAVTEFDVDGDHDAQGKVLLQFPVNPVALRFDTFDLCRNFLGYVGHCIGNSYHQILALTSLAGDHTAFFLQTLSTFPFVINGPFRRTATTTTSKRLWKDASTDTVNTRARVLVIGHEFGSGQLPSLAFESRNELAVRVFGDLTHSSVDGGQFVTTPATAGGGLTFTVFGGAKCAVPSNMHSAWTGSVSRVLRADAYSIAVGGTVVAADWDSVVPTTTSDAIHYLARRHTVSQSFVNPVVFDRPKFMRYPIPGGGAAALSIDKAVAGHGVAAEIPVTIYLVPNSVTALALNAAYKQDVNPFVSFDPAKGYLIMITRFSSSGSSETQAVYSATGRVITP